MAWDLKSYVLALLFYRFIKENLTAYLNESERKAGIADFDYAALSDEDAEFGRRETVVEKGFYILPSELFANVRAGPLKLRLNGREGFGSPGPLSSSYVGPVAPASRPVPRRWRYGAAE